MSQATVQLPQRELTQWLPAATCQACHRPAALPQLQRNAPRRHQKPLLPQHGSTTFVACVAVHNFLHSSCLKFCINVHGLKFTRSRSSLGQSRQACCTGVAAVQTCHGRHSGCASCEFPAPVWAGAVISRCAVFSGVLKARSSAQSLGPACAVYFWLLNPACLCK